MYLLLQSKDIATAKITNFHTITKRIFNYATYLLYILLYTNINKGIDTNTHTKSTSAANSSFFIPTMVLSQYGSE